MGPVIQQVVRGNGRSNIGPGLFDELDRIGGGDMFEYYLEVGKVLCDSREFGVDKCTLAVKHIDLGVGDFAVNEERDASRFQAGKERVEISD